MQFHPNIDSPDICCHPGVVASAPNILSRARGIFARSLDAMWTWQQRGAARRALAGLDDRMLRDVGIDRATAAFESSKPFWRA